MRLVVGFAALACLWACGESAEPELASTSQLSVVLMPESHDFGTVVVGQTSAPSAISVAPAPGASTDTVTAVQAACPDFAVTATGLPAPVSRTCGSATDPGGCTSADYVDYAFDVRFTPTVGGQVSCVIAITLDDAGGSATTSTVTVTGTGAQPPISIGVAPAAIAFGDVPTASASAPVPLLITARGTSELDVGPVTATAGFAVMGPTTIRLQTGQTQMLPVTCTPPADGALAGTLTIPSSDPQHAMVTLPLTCKGVTSDIGLTPAPATFPATRVGDPIMLTVTIANNNAATDTTFQSAAVTGTGFTLVSAPTAGTDLPAAEGTTYSAVVQFDAAAHGPASGQLTVVTAAGTRSIALAAAAGQPALSLTPDGTIDFGPVCIGATASRAFSGIDDGDASFQFMSVSPPAPPFMLTAEKLPVQLSPVNQNQNQNGGTFTIAVTPTDPGTATASATITTDIPLAPPRMLQLTALGLGSGTTATPASLDLGSYPLDTTSLGAPIAISNCSAAPLALANARLEGADAAEFALVQEPSDRTAAANGAVTWFVAVTPHTAGRKQAQFAVDDGSGTTTSVPLFAEGLPPPPIGSGSGSGNPDTGDEHNYYTCAAGGAGSFALVPVALGAGLALRRRRRRAA